MPTFLAAVVAAIAGNLGTDLARTRFAELRATLARRGVPGEPRVPVRRAPQLPDPRVTLTPPVTRTPWALPRRTADELAARLAAARR